MSEYIIQTNNLTKQYGEQKSVSAMNLHVKKGRIYGCLLYTSPSPRDS